MSTDVLIYCNGDSFVNGCELADELLKDHPGYYDFDQRDNHSLIAPYTEWYTNSMNINHELGKRRQELGNIILKGQSNFAFSNIIQQQTGLNVINAATGYLGNSQASITQRTIADLCKFKGQYNKIIAIIGTTSINRILIPIENPCFNYNCNNWENKMLTYNNNLNDSYYSNLVNKYVEFYHLYYTDYHLLYEWYKNLLLIKMFCKENNIKLLWTTGIEKVLDIDTYNLEDINALRNQLNLTFDVSLTEIAKQINTAVICPGYHYSHIVHKKAAEEFISLIYKNMN